MWLDKHLIYTNSVKYVKLYVSLCTVYAVAKQDM